MEPANDNLQNEPQETKVGDQFDSLIQAFAGLANSQSDSISENLQKEAVIKAQEDLARAESIRTDLFKDIEELEAQATAIRKKIILNLNSDSNPKGCLRNQKTAYDKCIHIDVAGLNELVN